MSASDEIRILEAIVPRRIGWVAEWLQRQQNALARRAWHDFWEKTLAPILHGRGQ